MDGSDVLSLLLIKATLNVVNNYYSHSTHYSCYGKGLVCGTLRRLLLRFGTLAFILRDSASSLLCLCLLFAFSIRFSSACSESDSSCRCSLLRFLGCTILFGLLFSSSSSSSSPLLEDDELSSPPRNERFLRVTERLSSLEVAPESLRSRASCSLSSSGELSKSDWDPEEEEEEKEPSSLSSRMEAGRPICRFFDASTLVFRIDANIFRLYKLSMSARGTGAQ